MKSSLKTMSAPQELLDFAHNRSNDVVKKINAAIAVMESEIAENDGLYPLNGGRINQAEVCRRAKVSKVTLQGKSHKSTTKAMVDKWVDSIKQGVTTGKGAVRKEVAARANAWKEAHAKIATAYHIDQLKLIDANKRIKELERETAALREQLSVAGGRKIVSMPKRGA
jgi:hypothetical protein